MATFKATVQYGDWDGTAAADNSSHKSLNSLLLEKKLIQKDEFVLGLNFFIGDQISGGQMDQPSIQVLLFKAVDFEAVQTALGQNDDTLEVREVTLELTLQQFFSLFKRFALTLTSSGLNLAARDYRVS